MKTPFVITHLFDSHTIRIKMDLVPENDFLIDAMTALGYMVDNPLNTQWFDIPVPEDMVEMFGFIRDEASMQEAIHGYVKKFFADLRRDAMEEDEMLCNCFGPEEACSNCIDEEVLYITNPFDVFTLLALASMDQDELDLSKF
ncbi:hypothetical protein VPHD479_0061 [Vibrio phage D479]